MNRLRIILVLMLSVAMTAAAHTRQTPPADFYTAPIVEPAHHISFGPNSVKSVAFDPGGKIIYALVEDRAVCIGFLFLHWRREVLGGALLLISTPLALRARRILKRPQQHGHVYCRACNYDLAAQVEPAEPDARGPAIAKPGAKCPECGVELARARPVRGRPTRGGLAPIIIMWALLAGGYALMWPSSVANALGPRFRFWTSSSLYRLAEDRKSTYLMAWSLRFNRIHVIDLATGRTLRTMLRTNSEHLAVSPDGAALVLAGPHPNEISAYRARSGRRVRTARLPGVAGEQFERTRLVGWSQDGQTVYWSWLDKQNALTGFSAWDWRTGKLGTVLSEDALRAQNGPEERYFAILGASNPPRFISWPGFMEAETTHTLKIRLFSEHEPAKTYALNPELRRATPAATPDGRMVYLATDERGNIVGIDTSTGQIADSIATDGADNQILVDHRSRLMFDYIPAIASRGMIAVRDLSRGRWTLRLQLPEGVAEFHNSISARDDWVAAVCERGTFFSVHTGPPSPNDLVLWHLPPTLVDQTTPPK